MVMAPLFVVTGLHQAKGGDIVHFLPLEGYAMPPHGGKPDFG